MEFSRSPSGFRSRRSYPSLNHISLAPLTPRFPIDDDEDDPEPVDYFTPKRDDGGSYIAHAHASPTGTTSYLSSFSVPGTPGVLSHSHSRSGSRARHHQRSKSSTLQLSDLNLQGQDVAHSLHHSNHNHHHHHGDKTKRHSSSRHEASGRRDSEWMLRAGIALASSTREEKGQSWLVKRESSTSLVSEGGNYDVDAAGRQSRAGRRSRSGLSTPAAYSRRASRSRPVSRRGSRPDFAMTGLDMTSSGKQGGGGGSGSTAAASPADDGRHFVPDFVDERIRAEMQSIQQDEEGYYSSETDDYFDSEDEIDEQELQRLTRERGFGLGSWIDRMVEWTLFGVDDWPLFTSTDPVENNSSKHVEIASQDGGLIIADRDDDVAISGPPPPAGIDDDNASLSDMDVPTAAEKPGDQGGWEDAGWLLRTMKRAFV